MTEVPVQIAPGARYRHLVFKHGRRRSAVDLSPRLGPRATALLPPPTSRSPRLTEQEERFVKWLFELGGLDARAYRSQTLHRRLAACLRAIRAASVVEARVILQQHPAHLAAAVGAMLIGVTGFFRDAGVFDHLARTVLPALPRTCGHPRVWSAACSDGQELYSVAMLLAEAGWLRGSYLLGSDCRPQALARARAGRYENRALADVPEQWHQKYFVPDGPFHRVSAELRGAAQWRSADLTRLREPGTWDLILCRNLTMYLRPEVTTRLLGCLESALRPGGFLVLGKAERPLGASRLAAVAPCIYRREERA